MSTELSVEQIIRCNPYGASCVGGNTYAAYDCVFYETMNSAKGLVAAADYPYTSYNGITGTCDVDTNKAVIGLDGYYYFFEEHYVAAWVQATGPLSVMVDVTNWNTYAGGVMTVCGQNLNAYAQAVGVDASTGGYWKVRNSWGKYWGEAGFIRLAYGNQTCGIGYDVSYVAVQTV